MCQRVILTRRRVKATILLPAFLCLCCKWFTVVCIVHGWGEVFQCWCVVYTRRHQQLPAQAQPRRLLTLSHFCISGSFIFYISSVSPYNCYTTGVWVLWTLYTPSLTTLTGSLGYRHPCQESLGPHLRKHCLRVLTFLVFILGCPTIA